ncbi:hypothetical protein YC2023_066606 [Brassica napus]
MVSQIIWLGVRDVRSPRGLLHNQCGVSGGMTAFSDVTEEKEKQKPASRKRILMTHSFLERIGQPEVDLANHREESAPFNVHDATSILEFSSSQMFSNLFRDSLGTTKTERNALVIEDFSKRLNRYFEGLRTFLLLRFGMIDNPGRFKDDAWTVFWLFPRSELDMHGDHFSIFREFRSVCKIWLNSYGTIYRDMKNHLRLRSLNYPPRFYVP